MYHMESFADEMMKIAVAKHAVGVKGVTEMAKRYAKPLSYAGAAAGGIVGYKGLQRLYENQRMAEAMRERMAAARGD